jgi:ferric-dicitrate binding protein FerR (iron transport regulator)
MSLPSNNLSITDFLEDAAFRRWMTERRPEDRLYWQEWLSLHPDKRDIYEQAVAAFLVIKGNTAELSDQELSERTQQLIELLPDEPSASVKPLLSRTWLRWVAAAAVISIAAWQQFYETDRPQPVALTKRNEEKQLQAEEWTVANNTTPQPIVILLPDHSSVLLSTGSSLRFRKEDNKHLREVFLRGEGFFEVAKNAEKPFLVYTDRFTTKVLGTTFQIRSFDNESTNFVKVKVGKVAVTSVNSPGKPVLLTEHQQLSLETKTDKVVQAASKDTEANPTAIINQQFTYEYTSVSDILDQLESAYKMPIRYEREKIKTCTFTGQLNDVPFPEKIRLICLTIESTYDIVDNQVIIHSKGCN